MSTFKKGDWCFCEFTLYQIMGTEQSRITEVSDGTCRLSGRDLSDRCFPVTLKIKRISDSVAYWSKEFHALKNSAVNHPDLNRELIRRWVDLCECEDEKEMQLKYDSLSDFSNKIINKIRDLHYEEVDGIRLLRQ